MSHHVTVLAEQAATAVHELAVLARPGITTLQVDELRAVTGALAQLTAGLPQVLAQLGSYLQVIDRLTITDGRFAGDPETAADHARTCLRHAGAAAAHLATALDAAHQTLGDIAETPKPQPRGSIFNRR